MCMKAWKSWKEFTHLHDYAVRVLPGDMQRHRLETFFHALFIYLTCTTPKLLCIGSPWNRRHSWGPLPSQENDLKNRHRNCVSFCTLIRSGTDVIQDPALSWVEQGIRVLTCDVGLKILRQRRARSLASSNCDWSGCYQGGIWAAGVAVTSAKRHNPLRQPWTCSENE